MRLIFKPNLDRAKTEKLSPDRSARQSWPGSNTSSSPESISISPAASVAKSYSPGGMMPRVFLEPSAKSTVRLVTRPSK